MTSDTDRDAAPDRYREWDAAYVLGALVDAERAEFERHLEGCSRCRAAVAELEQTALLMGRLSSEDALAAATPEPQPLAPPAPVAALARAAARRRRRARSLSLAAAVVAVALAAGGGVAIGHSIAAAARPTGREYALGSTTTAVTAEVAVTPTAWGTRLDWNCSYGSAGWSSGSGQYDLTVTLADGSTATVATWTEAGDEATGLAASTRIPLAQMRSIQIRVHGTGEALAGATLARS
jgi:hypothetical protein